MLFVDRHRNVPTQYSGKNCFLNRAVHVWAKQRYRDDTAQSIRSHTSFCLSGPHSIHSDIFRRFILPLKTRSGTHEYPHLAELARALKHRDIMVYCPDVSGTAIHAAGEIFTAENTDVLRAMRRTVCAKGSYKVI